MKVLSIISFYSNGAKRIENNWRKKCFDIFSFDQFHSWICLNEASGSLYPILYLSSSTFFEIVFENGVSIERPGDIAGYLRNQINTQGVDKPSINIFFAFFQ